MSSWNISKRIYVGFGSVLAILLVLGGIGIFETLRLGGVFFEYRETGRNSRDLLLVKVNVLEARMAAINYRLTSNPEKRSEVETSVAEVIAARDELRSRFSDDPAQLGVLEDIANNIAAYQAAFETFSALRDRRQILLGELESIGAVIEEWTASRASNAAASGDSEAAMLAEAASTRIINVRLAISQFLATGSLTWLDTAFATSEEVERSVRSLASRSADDATVLEQAERLRGAVDELRSIAVQSKGIASDQLDRLGPVITGEIDRLADISSVRQDELGPRGVEIVESASLLMFVLTAVALLVGTAFAVLIGRNLSRRISETAGAMDELAGGNLDVAIVGTEHDHELGRMARALETFLENARKIEQLAKDKEMQERAAEQQRHAMMTELQQAFGSVVDAAVDGNFDVRVPAKFPDAELNHLAEGVNRLLETVRSGVEFTLNAMFRMSEGNLEIDANGNFSGAFKELERNTQETIEKFRVLVAQIRKTSDDVAKQAEEMSSGAGELSSRVEQQASALEETAATMEQMSATVKTNAENAEAASDLSSEASRLADRGREVVEEAVSAMNEIEDGAGKISDIISVIDGIAFQTNLLALNAAVEAARAGEAGKGFAVVASEVRSLAQRSGEAASDIRRLIQSSSEQVVNGVRLVEQTGSALDEIVTGIQRVAQTISGITDASKEQASGISEISQSVSHMDQMTQQNAALAQQSSTSAKAMEQHAVTLDELVGFFKTRDVVNRPKNAPSASDKSAAA